jgi:hypothetical protein
VRGHYAGNGFDMYKNNLVGFSFVHPKITIALSHFLDSSHRDELIDCATERANYMRTHQGAASH